MRNLMLTILTTMTMTIQAGQSEIPNLGSGHRGLVFTEINPLDPQESQHTVALACNLNPGYFLAATFVYGAPDTKIILKELIPLEKDKTLPPHFWSGWTTKGLFSFETDAAFDGRNLFRIENGHIRIYPRIAMEEARRRYQLKDDHLFLGAFEGRVFYWVKGHPREVFFRSADHTYRFRLQKRVTEPLGMAKGDPKGDLALYAVMMPRGWFSFTPRTLEWAVLNVKDAERIE